MKLELSICDLCRFNGRIEAAVGWYYNRQYGRILEICQRHVNAVLLSGGESETVACYMTVGDCDREDIFDSPSCSIFAEAVL